MPRKTPDAAPKNDKSTARSIANPEAFSTQTLKFLRGLARNNDREWFEERRMMYEEFLRGPMLNTIAQVNAAMEKFAPLHVKAPEKTVLRIYRDTRFSKSKLPYKQHYGAWWGRSGMVKTSGAGYYFHLSAKQLHIAAGLYMPDSDQTLKIRQHLLQHHDAFRSLLNSGTLKRKMQLAETHALTRAPKGFAPDHPAIDVILCRNWGVDVEMTAEEAIGPHFPQVLAGYFRAATPLVDFLNAPLHPAVTKRNKPLFGLDR